MIFFLLAGAVIPVYGQGQPRTAASSDMAQSVIDRAEEAFKRGEEAQQKGLPDIARRFFDQAVDTVLNSGVDLRTNAKLDSYYRQLLERIHKYEAQPGDRHELEDRPEVVEPSLLDELSDLKDTDLAMTTPDGIKIFGSTILSLPSRRRSFSSSTSSSPGAAIRRWKSVCNAPGVIGSWPKRFSRKSACRRI